MTALPYTLEGRALGPAGNGDGVGEAPCIFCGKVIKHYNNDGVGWLIGSVVDGAPQYFLVCDQPRCDERNAADEGIEADTPENQRIMWRCSCGGGGYVENVGATCHGCGALPAEVPWDDGWTS